MSGPSRLWWLGVGLVLVVAVIALGPGPTSGPPLDPRSTDPAGTRGLVELVEHFGAEVEQGPPTATTDVTLVLDDRLDDPGRAELLGWVRNGGLVVVADPSSPLGREPAVPVESSVDGGKCDVAGLERLEAVAADSLLLLPVEAGERSCFGDGHRAWLVVRSEGGGAVVLLGGASALVNQHLDEADNAAVVTALLAPAPGHRVRIVFAPVAGAAGGRTLVDLVPTALWWAAAQLAVALGLFGMARARRFGRPVLEPLPVELPGSLLVRAQGDLYRRTGAHRRAALALQRRTERQVRQRLGLPSDEPLPVGEVAARLGVAPAEIERLLVRPPDPARLADVHAVAADLDRLRTRLAADGRPPEPTSGADA